MFTFVPSSRHEGVVYSFLSLSLRCLSLCRHQEIGWSSHTHTRAVKTCASQLSPPERKRRRGKAKLALREQAFGGLISRATPPLSPPRATTQRRRQRRRRRRQFWPQANSDEGLTWRQSRASAEAKAEFSPELAKREEGIKGARLGEAQPGGEWEQLSG